MPGAFGDALPVDASPGRAWIPAAERPFGADARPRVAFDAKLRRVVLRTFIRAIYAWLCRKGRQLGVSNLECGSVTFEQRIGSDLRVNLHFHVLALDGVFSGADGEEPEFQRIPAPTPPELDHLAATIPAACSERSSRAAGSTRRGTGSTQAKSPRSSRSSPPHPPRGASRRGNVEAPACRRWTDSREWRRSRHGDGSPRGRAGSIYMPRWPWIPATEPRSNGSASTPPARQSPVTASSSPPTATCATASSAPGGTAPTTWTTYSSSTPLLPSPTSPVTLSSDRSDRFPTRPHGRACPRSNRFRRRASAKPGDGRSTAVTEVGRRR